MTASVNSSCKWKYCVLQKHCLGISLNAIVSKTVLMSPIMQQTPHNDVFCLHIYRADGF